MRLTIIHFAVLAALGLSAATAPSQDSVPNSVPESALVGEENFNFALLFQGDARGNFGPCG